MFETRPIQPVPIVFTEKQKSMFDQIAKVRETAMDLSMFGLPPQPILSSEKNEIGMLFNDVKDVIQKMFKNSSKVPTKIDEFSGIFNRVEFLLRERESDLVSSKYTFLDKIFENYFNEDGISDEESKKIFDWYNNKRDELKNDIGTSLDGEAWLILNEYWTTNNFSSNPRLKLDDDELDMLTLCVFYKTFSISDLFDNKLLFLTIIEVIGQTLLLKKLSWSKEKIALFNGICSKFPNKSKNVKSISEILKY